MNDNDGVLDAVKVIVERRVGAKVSLCRRVGRQITQMGRNLARQGVVLKLSYDFFI